VDIRNYQPKRRIHKDYQKDLTLSNNKKPSRIDPFLSKPKYLLGFLSERLQRHTCYIYFKNYMESDILVNFLPSPISHRNRHFQKNKYSLCNTA